MTLNIKLDEIRTTRIEKRKDGKWFFEVNGLVNGERKQIRKYGFKRKQDAQVKLDEMLLELKANMVIVETDMLYEDFLKQWMIYKKAHVRPTTFESYLFLINGYIIPYLKGVKLKEIKAIQIQNIYNDIRESGKLSDTSIQKVHTLIKDSLNMAVKWDLIGQNAASKVDRPKSSKKEMTVWDEEEVLRFLEFAKGKTRYYTAYMLALTTGMRQGEILGLRWKDIDFKKKILYVRQTLSHDGKELNSWTKTKSGSRSISLPNETVELLKEQKAFVDSEKKLLSDGYQDFDLVIPSNIGTPVSPRNLLRSWNSLIEQGEFERIRFHDLRHTHATLLLKQGVNPKIVAERLGHVDIRMTLDTYSHLLPSMQEKTAREFGEKLFGKKD